MDFSRVFSYGFFQNKFKKIPKVYLLLLLPFFAIGLQYTKLIFPQDLLNKLEAIPNFYLSSNTTNAYTAAGTLFTALTSNGFQLGTSALVNNSGDNYVAWNWKESTTSGLDIVTYTGTGVARTVAHNLGVTPAFIVIKKTNTSGTGWNVYHQSGGNTGNYVMESTAAFTADASKWNNTSPSTTNSTQKMDDL